MTNKFLSLDVVGEFRHLQIKEITAAGAYHRRTLTCSNILQDDEHQEVKNKASVEWTEEVKTAWIAFESAQLAQMKSDNELALSD